MTNATLTPEYRRAYYRRNVEKWKDYKATYNTANPEKVLFNSAKSRSKKNRTEFSIRVSDIVIPQLCPVLGMPLATNWAAGGRHNPNWNAPSLDRIDPRRGYVPGNIRVISWRANSLKRDGSLEEMRLVLADLEQLQDR